MSATQDVIGQILSETQERDAIHIAVEPVVAGGLLRPGQHILIDATRRAFPAVDLDDALGIVDPFLPRDIVVKPGERFFMFVYPNTITSLRHEWTHPELPTRAEIDTAQRVAGALAGRPHDKASAEKYLRNVASTIGARYGDMISEAPNGEGIFCGDNEGASWSDVEGGADEFWRCVEIVTGHKVSEHARSHTFFRCAC